MAVLAGIHLLKLQANVPDVVRRQAVLVGQMNRFGRLPHRRRSSIEHVPLMPLDVARQVNRLLDRDDVREFVRTCSPDLTERFSWVRNRELLAKDVLESLGRLLQTAKKAERAAAHPPRDYNSYCKMVSQLKKDLKSTFNKLEPELGR